MKVVGNEKTSLKIISAKTETTENELRACPKRKITLIKVVGDEKTSSKINRFLIACCLSS